MPNPAFDRYSAPTPTSYHHDAAAALQAREGDLWLWFERDDVRQETSDALRLELLQTTYRLDRDGYGEIYAAADQIAWAMQLGVEVTLYQGPTSSGRNAALYFEPAAAHVVFGGDLLKALDAGELRFVIGHELAHHKLWTQDAGRIWTAHRFLDWATREQGCAPAFHETARLMRLHTEVYADRFGLWATGDLETSVRALVKILHNLDEASGAAYLAQAREAIETGGGGSKAQSHPEGFLRAACLDAWAHDVRDGEAVARALIDGSQSIERLDLTAQLRLSELSLWMLREYLVDPWASRELIRAHAAQMSPELADALERQATHPGEPRPDIDSLASAIRRSDPSVQEYLSYLLLDFAAVDPELEETMLAGALSFADDFGLRESLRRVAAKELRIARDKLDQLERKAEAILKASEKALRDRSAARELPLVDRDAVA